MFIYFLLQHMDANLKSGFWLAREAEPHLEKTKYFQHFKIIIIFFTGIFTELFMYIFMFIIRT